MHAGNPMLPGEYLGAGWVTRGHSGDEHFG
jgi:hypothetical protein